MRNPARARAESHADDESAAYVDRAERRRHLFAAELLERPGRDIVVPWPVLVEVDLLPDIPDLIVMAMASLRRASVLTWDFRHFRAVVLKRGHHWPLVVEERDLPSP